MTADADDDAPCPSIPDDGFWLYDVHYNTRQGGYIVVRCDTRGQAGTAHPTLHAAIKAANLRTMNERGYTPCT